ncbi:MAG TPA: hypothetical protein VHB98_21175 [Chloroflexota bacterium]|jgi:hypothetical protein|nr:hypothetical protein [Chloroflexota bacterium]
MPPMQQAIDCPNLSCATPAALALCIRFAHGFGLQIDATGPHSARWDDIHCLVCGHFSTPYASARQEGRSLLADDTWLVAIDRALRQTKRGRLIDYLTANELDLHDLLAMRQAVQRLSALTELLPTQRRFPHVGLLHVAAEAEVPDMFGVEHGEAESEPFARKVQVLGRLLGADAAETTPRHCTCNEPHPSWFFYHRDAFIGLLCLEPNRSYRGTLTIDGCLSRLLRAG